MASSEKLIGESCDRKRPAAQLPGSATKRFRSAECIFREIKDKNRRCAGMGGGINTFDVLVKELPITMRDDCQLVLIEAPGLNSSNHGNEESRSYFSNNWDSLDAAIVVVDAQEKADHKDQIEHLRLIRSFLKEKEIPCFILCNKVGFCLLL